MRDCVAQPIDAVVTWVDGADPAHIALRAEWEKVPPKPPIPRWAARSTYRGQGEANENTIPSSHQVNRFRNVDELRYLLRSIERNAPWLRYIHIVTNGQVPGWLDLSHPRIRLVRHADIFQDQNELPTFNSHAIELNLRHIPDLAETFIYFNDDTLLGRPVSVDDFCTPDGKVKAFAEPGKTLPVAMTDRSLIGHVWAFNHNLLKQAMGGRKKRRMFAHTPQMYSRRQLEYIHEIWAEEIAHTIGNRFRTPFDVQQRVLFMHFITEGGLRAATGGDVQPLGIMVDPTDDEYSFLRFGDERYDYIGEMRRSWLNRPKFLCVNDEIKSGNDGRDAALEDLLKNFLVKMFPDRSQFEKPEPHPSGDPLSADPIPCEGFSQLTLRQVAFLSPVEGQFYLELAELGRPPVKLATGLLSQDLKPDAVLIPRTTDSVAQGECVHEASLHLVLEIPVVTRASVVAGTARTTTLSLDVAFAVDEVIAVADLARLVSRRLTGIQGLLEQAAALPLGSSSLAAVPLSNIIAANLTGRFDLADFGLMEAAAAAGANIATVRYYQLLAATGFGEARLIADAATILADALADGTGDSPIPIDLDRLLQDLVDVGRDEDAFLIADALSNAQSTRWIGRFHLGQIAARRSQVPADVDDLLSAPPTEGRCVDLWCSIVLDHMAVDLAATTERLSRKFGQQRDDLHLGIALLNCLARQGDSVFQVYCADAFAALATSVRSGDQGGRLLQAARLAMTHGNWHLAQAILNSLRYGQDPTPEVDFCWAACRAISQHGSADALSVISAAMHDVASMSGESQLVLLQALLATRQSVAPVLQSMLAQPVMVQNIDRLACRMMEQGRVAELKLLADEIAVVEGGLLASCVQVRLGFATHSDDECIERLIDDAQRKGAGSAWLACERMRARNRYSSDAAPQPDSDTAARVRSIAFADTIPDGDDLLARQILAPVLGSASISAAWHGEARDPILLTFKVETPADVLLMSDLADRRFFEKRRPDKRAYLEHFRKILVPGNWLRNRILDDDRLGVTAEKVMVVGSPRIELLRSLQKSADARRRTGGLRKVLFAPLHDNWKDSDGNSMSCREAMLPHLPQLKSVCDLSVAIDQRNIIEKKIPITKELLEADVVITDYSSLIYEAWALGKPVIFPRWLTGDRVLMKAPSSAEAYIYREELGLHAQSIEELIGYVKDAVSPGPGVEEFIADYIAIPHAGSAGARIAGHLEDLADPARSMARELLLLDAAQLIRNTRWSEAIELLRAGLQGAEGDARLMRLLAEALAGQQMIDEAVAALRDALALDDRDPEAYMWLGQLELRRGKAANAAWVMQKATNSPAGRDRVDWLLQQAHAEEAAGGRLHLARARRALARAVELEQVLNPAN